MGRMQGMIAIAIAAVFSGVVLLMVMLNLANDTSEAISSMQGSPAEQGEGLQHDGPAVPVEDIRLTINGYAVPAAVLQEHVGEAWDADEVLCIGCIVPADAHVIVTIGDETFETDLVGPTTGEMVDAPMDDELPAAPDMPALPDLP